MMHAALAFARPPLSRDFVRRALAGGLVWGVAMTVSLVALTVWSCGGICLDQIVTMAAASVGAGCLLVGPACALTRRAS